MFKPIQARLFNRLKTQGVFRDPLIISETIKASPMKVCKLLVPRNAHQNTERNFEKSDIWRHSDVTNKHNRKILTSGKPDKLYIFRKVIWKLFENITCIEIDWLNQKLLSKISVYFNWFLSELSLYIFKSRNHGCQFWKLFNLTWFGIKF